MYIILLCGLRIKATNSQKLAKLAKLGKLNMAAPYVYHNNVLMFGIAPK